MLFNTFLFAFGFLPLALIGYYLISRYSLRWSIVFLFLASIGFYSYWKVEFLPLLLGSIVTNYLFGQRIIKHTDAGNEPKARLALITALVFNLSLLAFFKYADFFGKTLFAVLGQDYTPLGITLPIGISFFTFTQIAYLVDCRVAKVRECKAENYGLFVTYFPHLIAGPILHHKDMMPQFDKAESHVFSRGRLVVGSMFFLLGLFKKVVLADGVSKFVAPVFDINHAALTVLEAWCGALAYTFQLYFDFSAYSEMAYGLSYMFGIILPINFNSPYKSQSIIEFWRRWHITLSTFLRDYLYIPLGGNRCGFFRRYMNLLLTMLLGGLWHGANITFVIWGGLHGLYLIINHAARHVLGDRRHVLLSLAGWSVTFFGVVIAWVLFRANSLEIGLDVLRGMFAGTFTAGDGAYLLGVNRIIAVNECLFWLGLCAAVSFFLPNAYQVLGIGVLQSQEDKYNGWLGGLVFGVCLLLALLLIAISETVGVSEFLYFNF